MHYIGRYNLTASYTANYVLQVLLNYLPLKQALWASDLQKNRQLYQEFKMELIVNPRKDYAANSASKPQQVDDHVS